MRFWHRAFWNVIVLASTVATCLSAYAVPRVAAPPAKPSQAAAELLPGSTLVYLEIPHAKLLLSALLEHPLRAKIEATDEFKQATSTSEYLGFQFVLRIVESSLGMDWRKAIESCSDDELVIGYDLKTQGAVLLAKCHDEALRDKVRDGVMKLVRGDAANKGEADPYTPDPYRGLTAYKVNQGRFATLGAWLLLTNNTDLGKVVIDHYLDGGDSLATEPSFIAARKTSPGDDAALAWAYTPVASLREMAIREHKWKSQADNPLAELLVGGILSTLDKTPYATANLSIDKHRAKIEITAPRQAAWSSPARDYYFGANGQGTAPAPSAAKNALASVTAYRDLGKMWAAAAELFDDETQQKLAKADTDLGGFFQGQEFGRDVLGAMTPEIEIVAARQTFANPTAEPLIKLPGVALVMHLKDPAKMQPHMQASFQSLVGFTNVLGSQQGAPQLLAETEKVGNGKVVGTTYLLDDAEKVKKSGRINYNFTPSLGLVGDKFILSSTRGLAMDLVEGAGKAAEPPSSASRPNTSAAINLRILHDILKDNRAQLISQNMLEKGHDKPQAEREVKLLLAALTWLHQATLQLHADASSLKLELAVQMADE